MDNFQHIIMEVMASKIDNQPNRSCKICGKRERTMLNSNPKYCNTYKYEKCEHIFVLPNICSFEIT
jgi:hypothetical protein